MKCHLVSSPYPFPMLEAQAVEGVCGTSLLAPQIVMVWDEQEIGGEPLLSPVHFCRQCIVKSREERLTTTERRYLYGVVKGAIAHEQETQSS